MNILGVEIDWVLDWNRVANLILVLLPFFLAVGGGFKYLLDRAERRELARIKAADEKEEAKDKKAEEREEARDERRREEIEQMNVARAVFYDQIFKEAARMRELYENELSRGLSLRTALADAAQREMQLQSTVMSLTQKIEALQTQVNELRQELIEKGHTNVV